MFQEDARDFPRALVHGFRGGQCVGGGVVAVGGVLGNLHPGPDGDVPGELPGGNRRLIGLLGQVEDLVLGVLDHVCHLLFFLYHKISACSL